MPDTLSVPARARPVLFVALGLFVLHVLLAGRYGVFRDELYYVACGDHLAFGYVDHPPMVALMAKLPRALFGDSLLALRFLPAACAVATVLLAAELARALRGDAFAQLVAALTVAIAPFFLVVDHFLSMNCVEPVVWTGAALLAVRATVFARPRAWLAFGVVCGLGLLTKHSTAFFCAALAVGVLATGHRRALATWMPWLGVAIAAALVVPNVVWEIAHGWPTLEFMRNAQEQKMVHFGPIALFKEQLFLVHPIALLVWGPGLVWLLVGKDARPYRFLGIAYPVLFGIVLLGGGKPYYLAPVYPILFAAGGKALEGWIVRAWARASLASLVGLAGVALLPLSLPVLSPEATRAYVAAIGVAPSSGEKHAPALLPQHLADQFGWEAMAEKVAAAYAALSPAEQRVTAIYTGNYGEAGAIDYFGPRWGLPRAASGHNSYFTWGPPAGRGEILIAVGDKKEDLEKTYDDVVQVGETDEPYAMPSESRLPIYLCRRPRKTLEEVWPGTKHFI